MKIYNFKKKASVLIISLIFALAFSSVQAFAAWDDWHYGYATYTGSGYSGGNALLDPINPDMEITALNTEDYNSYGVNSSLAGAYLEVEGPAGKTVVYVTDRYPEGANGALDLCPISFGKIGDMLAGKIDIKWRIVKAPVTGNLSYRIKEGSSQYWAEIQVRNHKYPVLKMEYYKNGEWINMEKQLYNHFHGEQMGTEPLQIRITDILGQSVTDTLPALPGAIEAESSAYIVSGNVQFPDYNSNSKGIIGDVNSDGHVNSLDYAAMKSYLLGSIIDFPASDDLWAGDVNGDNEINSIDYSLIKSFLLGIITEFPKH
ncbi:expansin EXLX1 family cellulose-binding protein [Ruminiclostridium sufflavum]|nr:expansin EXLX1 family cellulose-binding protein [Ruminiclostridium sufflavum]